METVGDRSEHWQEIRCECGASPACRANCPGPPVVLDPPQGYLAGGPTFGGEEILAQQDGKDAVDRLLEMQDRLHELEAENQQLRGKLDVAANTISQQDEAIDTASLELQSALRDYSAMRDRLKQWHQELDALSRSYRQSNGGDGDMLEQFESSLDAILQQFENQRAAPNPTPRTPDAASTLPDATTQPAVQLELAPPAVDVEQSQSPGAVLGPIGVGES